MGIESWLAEVTPDRREVVACLDRRLVSELVKAQEQLTRAKDADEGMLSKDDSHKEIEARIQELGDGVRERSRTFVFEGLGWGAWRKLLSDHPPVEDQAEVFSRAVNLAFMPHAVENIGYNAETFVPAAIAASCVEPGMSADEATQLLSKAPPGVIERIWSAVLEVNLAGGNDPLVPPAVSAARSRTAKK